MKIEIELNDEEAALLEVLTRGPAGAETVKDVIHHLMYSAIDGVRRPGSWERQWLYSAFSDGFEEFLEIDPACDFYQRPKAGRR